MDCKRCGGRAQFLGVRCDSCLTERRVDVDVDEIRAVRSSLTRLTAGNLRMYAVARAVGLVD